jgi:hypothetical protein
VVGVATEGMSAGDLNVAVDGVRDYLVSANY